ncbi:MAG: hypothetical protein GY898_07465 [Proteobacteria bacterium]|nr:hypothetical protein [Pseudomonadota bacterium]
MLTSAQLFALGEALTAIRTTFAEAYATDDWWAMDVEFKLEDDGSCVAAAASLVGCPTVQTELVADDGYGYCAQEDRIGGFFVQPEDAWTTIQGTVADATNPTDVFDVTMSEGDCELWYPRVLFCDPGCASGEVCDVDGAAWRRRPTRTSARSSSWAWLTTSRWTPSRR